MIGRLIEELQRKKTAGVDIALLTLWFNPKTFAEMEAKCKSRGEVSKSWTAEEREKYGQVITIFGTVCKLSDRVPRGKVAVTIAEEVLAEWDLTAN